jgi:hypothetical protein
MAEYQVILKYGAEQETLTILPGNIDKIGVQFIRNEFYYSLLRSLTMTLDFAFRTGGGGRFILNAYNIDGIKANVDITINKLNHANNVFELFYQGVLNFTPGQWTINRDTISIATMESSKMQRFISRDTIDFDILKNISADNITMPDFVNKKTIKLTPIDIILNATAVAYWNETTFISNPGGNDVKPLSHPVWYNNGIGDRLNLNSDPDPGTHTITVYSNNTEFASSFKIDLSGYVNNSGYLDNRFHLGVPSISQVIMKTQVIWYDSTGNILFNETASNQSFQLNTDESKDFDLTSQINASYFHDVPPGGYVDLFESYIILTTSDYHSSSINTTGSLAINFQEYFQSPTESTAKCFFPHEAFTRLIQLATSEPDIYKLFESDFFGRTDSEFLTYNDNGEGALDAITTGYLIRNFPNPTFPVNIRDLFKSFDAVYNLGLGYNRVNDRFYIEKKDQFFQTNYFMFDLGDVRELKITAMSQAYFSKLTGGFENKGDYWNLQGAYEFNVQREDSLSTPVKETKDIRSKYNWDSIGMELARRQQWANNDSLDTKQDNNIYIVRTDGEKPVLNPAITGFSGIQKYYNTMLTPRQNIIRWANILRACLFRNNDPVKYQTSSKVCPVSYNGVSEFSDIPIKVLNESALFRPELYNFKSFIDAEKIQILNTNPHGYITFTFNKVHYEGFLNNVQSGDYNKDATYELIAKEIDINIPFEFENGDPFELESGEPFTLEGR